MGKLTIYHNEWKASFPYRPDFIDLYQSYPPPRKAPNNAGKEVWELYNLNEDPTELNNLARSHPAKLAEMKALFDEEARANQVYPLINWKDISVGIEEFQENRAVAWWRRAQEVVPRHHGMAWRGRHRLDVTVCVTGRACA